MKQMKKKMSTSEIVTHPVNHPEGHSTHRRPAFLKFPVATSSSSLTSDSILLPEKSISDLKPIARAYDGTPIIIVPIDYFDIVCRSFESGMYGFDTESDCHSHDLRIIQIYTGKMVYIFDVTVFDRVKENLFIKFLRAKDRVKIGVDIDTDIFRIQEYYRKRKENNSQWKRAKEKFAINGCLDIQSVARSMGESIMGLDKLGTKYVSGFKGNPTNLGHYNPPTLEQYIYAANDAIVSLKIYRPLITNSPIVKSADIEIDPIFDEFTEMFTDDKPGSIREIMLAVFSKYALWADICPSKRSGMVLRAFGEMSRRGYFTHFNLESDIIWLSNKEWPPKEDAKSEPIVAEESEKSSEPQKKIAKSRSRTGKSKRKKKPLAQSLDYIDAMVKEIDSTISNKQSSKTPPTQKSPSMATDRLGQYPVTENPAGLKVQMQNNKTKSIFTMNLNPKSSSADVANRVMEQIRVLDEVIGAISKSPIERKRTMHETFLQTFGGENGAIDAEILKQVFPDNKFNSDDVVQDALLEMHRVESEMTDEIYGLVQNELLGYLVAGDMLATSINYREFIRISSEMVAKVLPKYKNGSKKVLLANIFVHIGLENGHFISNKMGDLRFAGSTN